MSLVLVGRGRNTRSATGEGCSGFFSCVLIGEESRVLLRSALRSTTSPQTALRRTFDPSPSMYGEVRSALRSLPSALLYGFPVERPSGEHSSVSFTTVR